MIAPTVGGLVPRPSSGRVVAATRTVRLGDVTATGRLRLDALARYLQDVANDDRAGAGVDTGAWVTRRVEVVLDGSPDLGTRVELATWCSGVGARWAERRTDLHAPGTHVAAAAIWVHVDPVTGRPRALPDDFHAVWGPSAAGRRVRARLVHPEPPARADPSAVRTPWTTRVADLDVLGHVNNAVHWAAVEEALAARAPQQAPVAATLEYRGGLDRDDPVDLVHSWSGDRPGEGGWVSAWLVVREEVRASAVVELAPRPTRAGAR